MIWFGGEAAGIAGRKELNDRQGLLSGLLTLGTQHLEQWWAHDACSAGRC